MRNSLSSQTITNYLTVSNIDCMLPTIQLDKLSPLFYEPIVLKRSDIVDVCATVWITCQVTQTYTKAWQMFSVDSLSGIDVASIDLSSNPTSQLNNLVIPANTLTAGLYRLKFKVNFELKFLKN